MKNNEENTPDFGRFLDVVSHPKENARYEKYEQPTARFKRSNGSIFELGEEDVLNRIRNITLQDTISGDARSSLFNDTVRGLQALQTQKKISGIALQTIDLSTAAPENHLTWG